MKRKAFYGTLFAVVLILSGCGSDDTTCRIDVQNAMDKGDFDTAVSKLEGECASTFSSSDKNYNLALAYMGKAGYSVTDVLVSLLDANNDSGDAFVSFASSISATKQENSAAYLQTSQEHFLLSVTTDINDTLVQLCATANSSDNLRLRDACYYYGFNQAVTTVDTLSYLTSDLGTALDSINNDSNATPDDLQASLDALAWAVGDASITNVSDSNITINGNAFKHLDVNVSGKSFYRLATDNAPDLSASTVLTDGYCDENGSKTNCEGIELSDGDINTTNPLATGCYACPVGVDTNSSINVASVLIDALNNGTDTIASLTDDADTQASIDDLKLEIDTNSDGNITSEELINYLNK
ncbi:hypothetical protein [Sulfurimonas sp.]|uniref:hypothetical protein n=1 Tax=Sulfurimonas sp. TaxID=2022749 RepID=UPI003D0BF57C